MSACFCGLFRYLHTSVGTQRLHWNKTKSRKSESKCEHEKKQRRGVVTDLVELISHQSELGALLGLSDRLQQKLGHRNGLQHRVIDTGNLLCDPLRVYTQDIS